MSDDPHAAGDELQFDRVVTAAPTSPDGAAAPRPAVVCAGCGTALHADYYHVNGKPACERCRDVAVEAARTPRGVWPMARAAALGLLAAIAGAAVYYGVIAITQLEIGIVAILIGYMVGWAVRKGAAGRGGRRFQVLAVVLTYWSVGLAYSPLAFKELGKGSSDAKPSAVVADSTAESTADPARASTAGERADGDGPSAVAAIGVLLGLVFALPVFAIFASMPGGLLSAVIIFFGLQKAWQMTGAPPLAVTGPHRVGAGPATAG